MRTWTLKEADNNVHLAQYMNQMERLRHDKSIHEFKRMSIPTGAAAKAKWYSDRQPQTIMDNGRQEKPWYGDWNVVALPAHLREDIDRKKHEKLVDVLNKSRARKVAVEEEKKRRAREMEKEKEKKKEMETERPQSRRVKRKRSRGSRDGVLRMTRRKIYYWSLSEL